MEKKYAINEISKHKKKKKKNLIKNKIYIEKQ